MKEIKTKRKTFNFCPKWSFLFGFPRWAREVPQRLRGGPNLLSKYFITKVLIKYIHFIYSLASFLRIVFLNVRVSTNLWGSAGQVWQAARFDYDKFEWQTPFKSWNVSSLIHSSLIHYPQKRAMQLMLATSIAPLLAVGRVPLPEDARFWAESSSEKKKRWKRETMKKK